MFKFPNKPQSIGEVFSNSFELYKLTLTKILPLSVTMMIISSIFSYSQAATSRQPTEVPHISLVAIILMLILMVISAFFVAAILHRIYALAANKNADLMLSLHTARAKLLTIIAAMFMVVIPVLVGFMLLIIPGIILSVLFVFYMPLIIFDNEAAFESIKKSCQLVWNNWWRVFTVMILPVAVATLIMMFASIAVGEKNLFGRAIIEIIVMSLFIPFFNAVILLQYKDCKLRKSLAEKQTRIVKS